MSKTGLSLPRHIGIIMDGNGRWAEKRGLDRSLGHKAGADNLKKLLPHIYNRGVKYLSIFAFSTENFKRAKAEVDFLMDLFVHMFSRELKELKELGVKVVFSGRRENVPNKLWEVMTQLEQETESYSNGVLNICLNYGGQYEILDMTKRIATLVKENTLSVEAITKEVLEENLYRNLPDLDLVIRTSGEKRNSNFMLYQSAYAEYCFPETFFPDFTGEEFDKIIVEFNDRTRRFGGN